MTGCATRQASSPRPAERHEAVTMRASTWGRKTSLVSSSSRFSSKFMRERRSVNSDDARSIMASAKRELRISSSIVSTSTNVSKSPRPEGSGMLPDLAPGTVPLPCAAVFNMETMLLSQNGAARRTSGTSSRRFINSGGSATWLAKTRTPRSTACTTAGIPLSSPST